MPELDMIRGNERATVQGPKIRADVKQDQVGLKFSCRESHHAMERGGDPEGLGFSIEAIRPLRTEFILHPGQGQIARDQRKPGASFSR